MARPFIILDEAQVEDLASIGCTMNEMASFFKCHIDTLRDNYSSALERGRDNGKTSVRRLMWAQAKLGNSVALKYLVHNILKEKIEDKEPIVVTGSAAEELLKRMSGYTDNELKAMHKSKPKVE